MRRITLNIVLLLLVFAFQFNALGQTNPNQDVIQVAKSFKDGGGYNKAWKGTGTAEEISFKGEKILARGEMTYCCGFTFTVVMRAAADRGLLKDKKPQQVREFQKSWYGATEPSKEKQCQFAMTTLGVGKAVSFDDAQPGDFVQLWREKSGHSVMFLGWVEEDGKKVGLRYRSSQGSTDGIGDTVEYFTKAAPGKSPVNRERTYFCRLNPAK